MSKKKHKSLNKKYDREILKECHTDNLNGKTQKAKENGKRLMQYFDNLELNDGESEHEWFCDDEERPCSVAKSIEESLKQRHEYKDGKRKFKFLLDSNKMWAKLLDDLMENKL
ncbi:hypothetical protein SAMN02745134_00817 [Clostridium acidisoli DSM 12555]|uniref:Uncharacterized protein n=1 Tax=Clostridium acidisoli DSM 12555 TaxID=1121291 RepID=A0A1W1X635_9CLOT|nr:hypothetical protein [Clostridium acidisoli]SMC19396.1 hypothetical protein SAMN02745134_00817 [Clostridium acidisoli DSM 12555]